MRVISFLLASCIFLGVTTTVYGQRPEVPRGYVPVSRPGWEWASRNGRHPPSPVIQEIIESQLQRIRTKLGVRARRPYLVIYCHEAREFPRLIRSMGAATPAKWVLALAFTGRATMVLNGSKLGASVGRSDRETVTHEIVHLVLGDAGMTIPRWYHEGLAQWLSGSLIQEKDRSQVAVLAMQGNLQPFDKLSNFLSETHSQNSLLYVQSHMFVAWVDARHGSEVHRRILSELRGHSFDEAFELATGEKIAEAEALWLSEQESVFAWLRWLWFNVGVFPVLALVLIGGFFYHRHRRRKKLARMAREEAREAEEAALRAYESSGGETP